METDLTKTYDDLRHAGIHHQAADLLVKLLGRVETAEDYIQRQRQRIDDLTARVAELEAEKG